MSTSKLSRLGRGLKAAVAAFDQTSTRYSIAGRVVTCPHCGGEEFDRREILMNTRGATFLNMDWLNRDAVVLTCRRCSRIEWFARAPDCVR
jgi:predicted nucleic-acid-binding Zn-ribbon protein